MTPRKCRHRAGLIAAVKKPRGGSYEVSHTDDRSFEMTTARRRRAAAPIGRLDGWRRGLPSPHIYYAKHVAKLGKPNSAGWAQGVCPLHSDHNKSLSVNVAGETGGWRCFAGCGGGDMVAFHQRLTGMDFKAAVCDLIGGCK